MNKIYIFAILVSAFFLTGCANDSTSIAVTPDEVITENLIQEENSRGNLYSLVEYNQSVQDGENNSILIQTNGRRIHITSLTLTATQAPTDVFLYEGINVTNQGDKISPFQKRRENKTNTTSEWFFNPNVSKKNLILDRYLITSEKKVGGVSEDLIDHWILESNTTYLIEGVNRGQSTAEHLYKVTFWEEEK